MKKFCKIFSVILLTTSLLVPSSVMASGRNDKIDALKSSGVVKGYPDGSLGLEKKHYSCRNCCCPNASKGRKCQG